MNIRSCFPLHRLFISSCAKGHGGSIRRYLTPASQCNEAWNDRLKEMLLQDVKPLENSYKLLEKEAETGMIHAIDLDLFVNSITSTTLGPLMENLKSILLKFRECKENYKILPSTKYGLLKLLVDEKYTEQMMTILDNPVEFGIFHDDHNSKIFMVNMLNEGKYAEAAAFAKHLMYQEAYGPPTNICLSMLSCMKYLQNEDQHPMVNYKFIKEEPEEDVYIKVRFRPYNHKDGHFDLTDENHIIGKTLFYAAFFETDDFSKHNAAILGLALFEKWNKLLVALGKASQCEGFHLATDVIKLVEGQLPKCTNEEEQNKLSERFESLRKAEGSDSYTFEEYTETRVKELIAQNEEKEIEEQKNIYLEWNKERTKYFEQLTKELHQEKLREKIEIMKETIQKEDDYVHFFDNEDYWTMTATKKDRRVKYVQRAIQKRHPTAMEDDKYVIPEMFDMSGRIKNSLQSQQKVKRPGIRYKKFRDLKNLVVPKTKKHCGFFLYKKMKTPEN